MASFGMSKWAPRLIGGRALLFSPNLAQPCCLGSTGLGSLVSSQRGDVARIEQAGHFGGMRAVSVTGECSDTLSSFVLMAFLSSGHFIVEGETSPKLGCGMTCSQRNAFKSASRPS